MTIRSQWPKMHMPRATGSRASESCVSPLRPGCSHGPRKGGRGRLVACASGFLSNHHGGLEDTVPSCQLSVAQCYLRPAGHFAHPDGIAGAGWEFSPCTSCLGHVSFFPMISTSLMSAESSAGGFPPAAKPPRSISLGCKGGIRSKQKRQSPHTVRNSIGNDGKRFVSRSP